MKRLKRVRIKLEARSISAKTVVFVASSNPTIKTNLNLFLKQRGCVVYDFETLRRNFPCDYFIIFARPDLLLRAGNLVKLSQGRLLFLTPSGEELSQNSKKILANFLKNGVDIRLGEIDANLTSENLASEVSDFLFGSRGLPSDSLYKAQVLPTPPPPLPTPPRPEPPPVKKITKKRKPLPIKRVVKWSSLILFPLIILLPIFYFGWRVQTTMASFQSLSGKMADGTFTSEEVAKTTTEIKVLSNSFNTIKKASGPLGQLTVVRDIGLGLTIGEELARVARRGVNLSKLGKDASSSIFSQQDLPLGQTIVQIDRELTLLENDLESLSFELSDFLQVGFIRHPLFRSLKQEVGSARVKIVEASAAIRLIKTMIPTISNLIGLEGKRVYLVLLQNNTELRPTGGFIGSYGLITFDKGKMVNLAVEDIYTADGQLRGHVDAPLPLQKYLHAEHWYLRDSNFDPDFFAASQQAEWFLKKEVNTAVDGVVALDLTFAKRILDAIGGLSLPDYNERITSDNFFLKAQVAAESNFFPGSTQKRDFLATFARAMVRELTTGSHLPWLRLSQAVKTSLDEKHLQLAFHDKRIQGVFDDAGWSGKVLPTACAKTTLRCLPDYFLAVDTNVGVNKANYYLSRSYDFALSFGPEELDHELTIHYLNESPGDTFPTGTYKSFTRFFIPKEASEVQVFIDKSQIESTIENYHDKFSVGVYIEVPVGKKKDLTIRYKLKLPDTNIPLAYQFLVQKQAGTERDILNMTIDPGARTIKTGNIPIDKASVFHYNSNLSIDRVFSLILE